LPPVFEALGIRTMSWISIVPIIFFFLFFLNSIVLALWLRPKWEKKGKPLAKKSWKGNITLVGMVVFGTQIAGYLVGLAAPVFEPSSLLGQWVEKHGYLIYFAWCTMAIMILSIVLELFGYPVKSKK